MNISITFAFLERMHEIAGKYYEGTVLVCGESVSQYDFPGSDNRRERQVHRINNRLLTSHCLAQIGNTREHLDQFLSSVLTA